MKLNISNPIEAIYLNIFTLDPNMELQITTTWIDISTCLLFVINFSPFKLFKIKSAVSRMAFVRQIYQFEIPR